MKCTGCFICCDESIRSNFPEIEEIEIIGCDKFKFNGIYKFNGYYNEKPQYIKNNGKNKIELYYTNHHCWSIYNFNSKKSILNQEITCPIRKWKEKHNKYYAIKISFNIVDYSNVIIKPAKLF